jgi:hypothetical protein
MDAHAPGGVGREHTVIHLARSFSDPNGDQIECQAQDDVGQPMLRTY